MSLEKELKEFLNSFHGTKLIRPDYTTNSKSYYDYLEKVTAVLMFMSKKIDEYDGVLTSELQKLKNTLDEYLEKWDENLEKFDESVLILLQEWMDDGTFEHIINHEIFQNKVDTSIFEEKTTNIINVNSFGTDLTAINHAIEKAQTLENATLYFGESITVNDTVNIPDKINVVMDAPLLYDGVQDRPALRIGNTHLQNFLVNLKLWVKHVNPANWIDDKFVGIQVMNAHTSHIQIVESTGFTVGFHAYACNYYGFTMNTVFLGMFKNNKIHVDVSYRTNGWTNANSYYDGLFFYSEGENVDRDMTAVSMRSIDGTYNQIDGNIFYSPRFEMGRNGTGITQPVRIDGGRNNKFVNIRSEEINATTFAICTGSSTDNQFDFVYTYNSPTTITTLGPQQNNLDTKAVPNLIFSSGALHKKAVMYDNSRINIKDVEFSNYYNGTTSIMSYEEVPGTPSATIDNDCIKLKNPRIGLSIFVDTNTIKNFNVDYNVKSGRCTLLIACYDEAGTILNGNSLPVSTTDGWGYDRYIKTVNTNPPAVNSGYGGCYTLGNNKNFKVHEHVKTIRVIIGPAPDTDTVSIRSFSVFGLSNGMSTNAFTQNDTSVNFANQPPTSGSYSKGQRISNISAAVGTSKGWVCTVGGTPGTWVSEGNL